VGIPSENKNSNPSKIQNQSTEVKAGKEKPGSNNETDSDAV